MVFRDHLTRPTRSPRLATSGRSRSTSKLIRPLVAPPSLAAALPHLVVMQPQAYPLPAPPGQRAPVVAARASACWRRWRVAGVQVRGQAQGAAAAAAEAEAVHDLRLDARLDRRLHADLGLEVRGRLRAAAARPRARARDPAAARGHPGLGADVHPVPGRGGGDEGAAQGRRRRGARRAWPGRCSARSAALVPLGLYALTGDELFKALAFVGFFLNLFNLLPVLPLDGGRAMAALSPWMWFVGYALLIAATVAFPNPIMILILLFGGLETWRRWRQRKSPEAREFHRVRPADAGGDRGGLPGPRRRCSRWAWTRPSSSATSGTSRGSP